jgi:uncharacterized membrane protein HdeD (DUF308 family)
MTRRSEARTRVFARVLGPFLTLVPGLVIVRAADVGAILQAFFQNQALVWVVGAFLLVAGLVIIAHRQHWSDWPLFWSPCSAGSWLFAVSC